MAQHLVQQASILVRSAWVEVLAFQQEALYPKSVGQSGLGLQGRPPLAKAEAPGSGEGHRLGVI